MKDTTQDTIQSRLIRSAVDIALDPATDRQATFQHSVLCQTCLPYRDPGDEVIEWHKRQGNVSLRASAGKINNPKTNEWIQFGLPYGPKARLILCYINSQAIRRQSREIEVEETMTSFVRRLGISTDGRSIKSIKDQLGRLSAAQISLAYSDGERGMQVDTKIIHKFDTWFPKDKSNRILWSSQIELSQDYFKSLVQHAIPLDERALAALSNNAMAIDIYCWLAQRLHRIAPNRPQFVDWNNLRLQFGDGYAKMYKFKQVFRKTLAIACSQYPGAKLEEIKNKGLTLYNSPAPLPSKSVSFSSLTK